MIDHPFHLRRLYIRNFKSVLEASVNLKPLTLIVGANSSGKSTLIQSLLVMTQAVGSRITTGDFALNGELIRLGTLRETRNRLVDGQITDVRLGFRLALPLRNDPPSDLRSIGRRPLPESSPILSGSEYRPTLFEWTASIGKNHGNAKERNKPVKIKTLGVLLVSADTSDLLDEIKRIEIEISSIEHSKTRVYSTGYLDDDGLPVFDWENLTLVGGRVCDSAQHSPIDIKAIELSGTVPRSVRKPVTLLDYLVDQWRKYLTSSVMKDLRVSPDNSEELQGSGKASYPIDKNPNPGTRAVSQAKAAIESLDIPARLRRMRTNPVFLTIPRGSSDENVILTEAFAHLMLPARLCEWSSELAQSDPGKSFEIYVDMIRITKDEFNRQLREMLGYVFWSEYLVLVPLSVSDLQYCCDASQLFFQSFVRYLGPLRTGPQVFYKSVPPRLDLGIEGEYTAAVLDSYGSIVVEMPTPDGGTESRPLIEALNWWLRRLDLAESVRTEDRGRGGIGLIITPWGLGHEVDLTSVGVGVSQLLPVILVCLIGESGSVVILEQPELHLHPALEQKLADFLIACARSGRQLLIETHSEHIVNRLRYWIASDESEDTHDLIGFLFAERHEGITSYRQAEINEYGGLGDDWPAGFLDLTARESQQLVLRSLAKRNRRAADNL